eukprot:6207475-Pleurochrysis_carterae.AAC.1
MVDVCIHACTLVCTWLAQAHTYLFAFAASQVLFVDKDRDANPSERKTALYYVESNGTTLSWDARPGRFPSGAHVFMVDDLIYSGTTLFDAARMIRERAEFAGAALTVHAFVTHFVAQCERDVAA